MFKPEVGDVITIGEEKLTVNGIYCGYNYKVTVEDGREYNIFENEEEAGQAAYESWEDCANNDPEEFVALVGADQMVSWAYDGGLYDWLEEWRYKAEENFKSPKIQAEYAGENYEGEVLLYEEN